VRNVVHIVGAVQKRGEIDDHGHSKNGTAEKLVQIEEPHPLGVVLVGAGDAEPAPEKPEEIGATNHDPALIGVATAEPEQL